MNNNNNNTLFQNLDDSNYEDKGNKAGAFVALCIMFIMVIVLPVMFFGAF